MQILSTARVERERESDRGRRKLQKLTRRLITRPIILPDEVILFNFVTLIAGVEVSNSGIRSRGRRQRCRITGAKVYELRAGVHSNLSLRKLLYRGDCTGRTHRAEQGTVGMGLNRMPPGACP